MNHLKPTFILTLLVAVVFGFFVVPDGFSQDPPGQQVNEYRRPGVPSMTLYVMGSVAQPGVWRFEREADFYEMMAVLSATGLSATTQVAIKQVVVIRVFRENGASRTQIYEQDLHKILQGLEIPPKLQDQDILVVETVTRPTRRITVQAVSSLIAAVSTGVLLYLRLTE